MILVIRQKYSEVELSFPPHTVTVNTCHKTNTII